METKNNAPGIEANKVHHEKDSVLKMIFSIRPFELGKVKVP